MNRRSQKHLRLTMQVAVLLATGFFVTHPAYSQTREAASVVLVGEAGTRSSITVRPVQSSLAQNPIVTVSRAANLVGRPLEPVLAGVDDDVMAALRSTLPIQGARLTSGVGSRIHPISGRWQYHRGVDLAASTGTSVQVAAAGTVIRAGWAGGYGNLVAIDHGDGIETRYGHLSRIDVRAGDLVEAGHQIGLVGSTGNSTGPHLHYEVLVGGQPIDPLKSSK